MTIEIVLRLPDRDGLEPESVEYEIASALRNSGISDFHLSKVTKIPEVMTLQQKVRREMDDGRRAAMRMMVTDYAELTD
jgi:hypothetical protein